MAAVAKEWLKHARDRDGGRRQRDHRPSRARARSDDAADC